MVTDSIGRPVVRANVYIRRSGTAAVLAYAYTDPSGAYRMERPDSDSLLLLAGALGYGQQLHRIPEGQRIDGAYRHDFRLAARPMALDEIILEERAIREIGDTIRIRVSEFMAGNEVVAEDLLRRLPGVDVDREGRITVQGKPVRRVLIEGDDLLDRHYQLLTRNLPAETIGRVEILRDYDSNPLLKPLRRTGEVALNLRLKEGVKRTGFVKGEAGGGPGGPFAIGLQGVRIRKSKKQYVFASLADPGRSSASVWTEAYDANGDSEFAPIGSGEKAPDFLSEGTLPTPLEAKRQLINSAGAASANMLFRPTGTFHVRANLMLSRYKAVREQRLLEDFRAEPLFFRNLEITRALRRQLLATASVKGTFTPSPGLRMEWHTHALRGAKEAMGQMELNGTVRSMEALENTWVLDSYLSGSWKADSTTVVSLDNRRITDRKPATLHADHFLFGPEFAEYRLADRTRQALENRLEYTGGELAFRTKAGSVVWQARLGFNDRHSTLFSELSLRNDSLQYVAGPAFGNSAYNRFTALYSEPGIEWVGAKLGLKLSVRATVNRNRFRYPEGEQRMVREGLEPYFTMRWDPDRLNHFVINYQYSLKQSGLDEQYHGYILRGYRNLRRGSGNFFITRGHRFTAGYTYGNWGEKSLLHLVLHGQVDPESPGLDRMQFPLYSLSETSLFKDRRMVSGNLALDRFLEGMSLNIKLRLAASAQSYSDRLNAQNRHIRTAAFQLAPEIRSVFEGPFQFHLGVGWDWNWNTLSSRKASLNAKAFLDLEWDMGKAGFITLHSDAYHTRHAGSTTLLSDLNWQFRNGKKGIGLALSATNLWNSRSLTQRYLTGTGFLELQERLRPRALMAEVSCRF